MKTLERNIRLNKIKNISLLASILLLLPLTFNSVLAQQKVCIDEDVLVYIDEYRGEISWQKSLNGTDWSYLSEFGGDTISLKADVPFFVRLEVIEGSCLPVYSDVMAFEINQLPIVEFTSRDSACINERDFMLSGGLPEGGVYFGPGVQDNRFNPSVAGIGIHNLGYSFTDPETTCVDSSYSQIEVFPLSSDAEAGEDFELIMSDSVQLQANTPDYGTGSWSVVSGIGGSFSDISDPNAWFKKDSSNLAFELMWTIEGPCGSNSDQVSITFMDLSNNPCPGTPIVIDADGNVYKTIQIDEQCWMAENLRTGTYVESTETGSEHSDLSNNGIIEKYCYENDTANCTLYGGLYDWNEAMGYSNQEEGNQGVCPDGWHIPSNQDWADLDAQFKYGDAGEQLKEGKEVGWGGQFAGDRHQRGAFYSFGSSGFFWSATTYTYLDRDEGYFRKICACNGALEKDHFSKITGLSVRCVKDK